MRNHDWVLLPRPHHRWGFQSARYSERGYCEPHYTPKHNAWDYIDSEGLKEELFTFYAGYFDISSSGGSRRDCLFHGAVSVV